VGVGGKGDREERNMEMGEERKRVREQRKG